MSDDPNLAKAAAIARQNLSEKLAACADALVTLAAVLASNATELKEAVDQEQAATIAYVSALEKQISQQYELS